MVALCKPNGNCEGVMDGEFGGVFVSFTHQFSEPSNHLGRLF